MDEIHPFMAGDWFDGLERPAPLTLLVVSSDVNLPAQPKDQSALLRFRDFQTINGNLTQEVRISISARFLSHPSRSRRDLWARRPTKGI
jgi:hypothetical protein